MVRNGDSPTTPRPLGDRFREALDYAAHRHEGQALEGTDTPYLARLLSVAATVLEHGGDEEQAIAALLHDAIEGRGGDRARREIRERFGERVERIVVECTEADVTPKPLRWQREPAHLARLATVHEDTMLVSMADKLYDANAIMRDYRCLGTDAFDRFGASARDTAWYYRGLVDAYEAREPADPALVLLEELTHVVEELERIVVVVLRQHLAEDSTEVDAFEAFYQDEIWDD